MSAIPYMQNNWSNIEKIIAWMGTAPTPAWKLSLPAELQREEPTDYDLLAALNYAVNQNILDTESPGRIEVRNKGIKFIFYDEPERNIHFDANGDMQSIPPDH